MFAGRGPIGRRLHIHAEYSEKFSSLAAIRNVLTNCSDTSMNINYRLISPTGPPSPALSLESLMKIVEKK